MAKLFPGILVATLVAIPAWVIGAFAASPNLLSRPIAENIAMFFRGTPIFFLLFAAITLIYGSLVWLALRSLGILSLVSLLAAAVLPVAVYVLFSLWRYGYDSGWHGAVLAFGIPALLIGGSVWLFTVRIPL